MVDNKYEEVNMSTIIQKEMIGECNEPRFTSEYFSSLDIDVENSEIIPIKYSDDDADTIVTHSMINNYVKLGIMPAQIRKKYSREHIAYLIIIFYW